MLSGSQSTSRSIETKQAGSSQIDISCTHKELVCKNCDVVQKENIGSN